MNNCKLSIILRYSVSANNKSTFHPHITPLFSRSYSKNERDGPVKSAVIKNKVEEKSDKSSEKSELILNKLNNLLMQMVEIPAKDNSPNHVKLAKPVPVQKRATFSKPSKIAAKDSKENVVKAMKEVAKVLGGDTKQTESELMKKLLNNSEEDKSAYISSLSDIFKDMKIDRSQTPEGELSRSQQVKQILNNTRQGQRMSPERRSTPRVQQMQKPRISKLDNIDIFGREPLGIFTANPSEYNEGVKNETWGTLKAREMKLAVTHPPSNYFQQMILWTEQGKLWKFPIDNEQGLETEKNVSFADHIFLEEHLEPWCPPRGPIRHFMELVCVGLSKNSYLTVEAKKEHIEWYRNYFEDKRQLLKEVGSSLNEVEQAKEIDSK